MPTLVTRADSPPEENSSRTVDPGATNGSRTGTAAAGTPVPVRANRVVPATCRSAGEDTFETPR
ncbi:hypothetical protein GCM10027194_14790 [Thalassiella azotivora]